MLVHLSNKLIEAFGGRCTRPNRAPPPCWALLSVTVNCTRLCGIPGMDLTVPGGPRQRGRPSTPGGAGVGRSSPHRLRQARCRLVQGRVGARLLPGETRVRAARPGTTPGRALTEQSARRTGRGQCARSTGAFGRRV